MIETPVVARARTLVEIGRARDAVTMLGPYLAESPGDGRALCVLAQAYLVLDDDAHGLAAAQGALRVEPEDEWALRLLASALVRQRRFDEARQAAAEAIRVDPFGWRCQVQRAQVDIAAHSISPASWQAAHRAIELAPLEPEAHRVLGSVALAAKKRRIAEAAFREALRLDPNNAVAHNNLGVVLLQRRRLGRATELMMSAAGIDPMSPTYISNVGISVRAWFSYLAIAGFVLVRVAFVAQDTHGAVALCAAIDVVLAAVFWWRLSRVARPAFGRYLRATLKHDRAMGAMVVLPMLGVLCLAVAALVGRHAASGWLVGCIAADLVTLVAGRLISRANRKKRR